MKNTQQLKLEKRKHYRSVSKQGLPQNLLIKQYQIVTFFADFCKEKPIIASYRAMKGEFCPLFIQNHFQQLYPDSLFLFPKISNKEMQFMSSEEGWVSGVWPGNLEPKGKKAISVEKIDIFFIPGLAFDRKGRRLGRGKGFYDRTLSGVKGIKIGLVNECQFSYLDLPEEDHDLRMDAVITNKYVFFPISKTNDNFLKKVNHND